MSQSLKQSAIIEYNEMSRIMDHAYEEVAFKPV